MRQTEVVTALLWVSPLELLGWWQLEHDSFLMDTVSLTLGRPQFSHL